MSTEPDALRLAKGLRGGTLLLSERDEAAEVLERLHAQSLEDERLLREAMGVLETGRDAMHELAARYHDEMRFHYPDVHASMDSDVVRADTAIAALRKRLGE